MQFFSGPRREESISISRDTRRGVPQKVPPMRSVGGGGTCSMTGRQGAAPASAPPSTSGTPRSFYPVPPISHMAPSAQTPLHSPHGTRQAAAAQTRIATSPLHRDCAPPGTDVTNSVTA